MINISNSIIQAFKAEDREVGVRLTFNDSVTIDGEYVKDLEITEIGSSGVLSLGNTCSNQLILNMYVPENFIGIGNAKIKVELGVMRNGSFSWTDAGEFFVDSYKTNNDNKSVNITAYDAMQKVAKLGASYTCGRTETRPYCTSIIRDILSQAGISDAYIGNSGGSATHVTDSKNLSLIHYNDDGTVVESDSSVGFSTNLIELPKSDKVSLSLSLDYDVDSFNLVFFTDAQGQHFHSKINITDVEYEYDFEQGTTTTYITNYTLPRTLVKLYVGICSDLPIGVTLDNPPAVPYVIDFTRQTVNFVNPSAAIDNPHTVNISPRNMLGYMCGILGCNCMIDKHGHFVLRMIKPTISTVELESQYKNGFETDNNTILTPTYITTGYDSDEGDNVITVGSGTFGFNFENPYITAGWATNILNAYTNISFMSGRLDYRYNPAIELNDIIYVENLSGNMIPFFNSQQNIKLYGGLRAEITCEIDREATSSYVAAPMSKTVSQIPSDIEVIKADILSVLSGNNGGYVKFVYDSQDKIRAIAIPTRDIDVKWDETAGKVVVVNSGDRNTPMWVWSDGGLAHTPDGGTTYNAAMTSNGGIVAEKIVGDLGRFVGIQAEHGQIGGWTITANELYSDVTINDVTYRAFIQNATAAGANSWIFSVQQKNSDNTYTGKFLVTADGKLYCSNLFTTNGYNFFSTNNNFVFGLGAYQSGLPTFVEGDSIYLRHRESSAVEFQRKYNDTVVSYLTANYEIYNIFSSDVNAWRTKLKSSGGFIVSANNGNNDLILEGSSIFLLTNNLSNGTLALNNYKIYTSPSAKKYKENITADIDDEFNPELLYELPIKQFNIKKEYKDKFILNDKQIGFIADDVDKIYPLACVYDNDNNVGSWNERIFIPAMLKLIQEQKKEIDSLNDRLTKLENLVNKLTEE